MSVSAPAIEKANGLSTVLDVITLPAKAFETLRTFPTWGWACLIALLLMLVGTFLQGPAARHAGVAAMQHAVTTSSFFAKMTPAQQQQAVENAGKPNPFSYVTVVLTLFVVVFFNTLFMLIGNAVGRGKADFKRLWCGSMNIAVPTLGIGAVVLGLIATVRGPEAFNSMGSIYAAMPGLGMLAPENSGFAAGFLSAITIFSLWGAFLNATMLRTMAKTSAGIAYTFAAIVLLLGALTTGAFVGALHNMGFA